MTAPLAVLESLGRSCDRQGLGPLATRLRDLRELTSADLLECERSLDAVLRGPGKVRQAAGHLLLLRGKRLRPLCVSLAARVGAGPGASAAVRELAAAVELVHAATLLHDDVVDLGELRRGVPAARVVYGNTASIFAGDLLLVEALRRVRRAGVPGTLERLLDAIEEMIGAESLQLESRGRLDLDQESYLRIALGKTAALFRWAMVAGGLAGGLSPEGCAALEGFGLHLGVAFQAVDDLLDLTGELAATGKTLWADLAEGKMTLPLILAAERDPRLRSNLRGIVERAAAGEPPTEFALAGLLPAVRAAGGLEACRAFATGRAALATKSLETLPHGAARDALEAVAQAAVERDR